MQEIAVTQTVNVELKKTFPITKPKLYELLTTPDYMERWFSPAPDIHMKVIRHDARVGAPYELHYHQPDGSVHYVVGEYIALQPYDLISFSWGWKEPDPHAGIQTLVTMTLRELPGSTELSVTHEQLLTGDMAERHKAGWASTLDRLQTLILALKGENHGR